MSRHFFLTTLAVWFLGSTCLAQETHQHTNRLAKESSPYLLQHAHNPVDWYPWGEEALQKAKRENKMIFLSVGYAACHWCHVMERESFVDPEIAKLMNEYFVCVKVDREERPDVDQIYMTAVHLVSRNGGWPMSVFLLPDGKPFWGGTYFPARTGDRGNATGFMTVLKTIQDAWIQKPDAVKQQSAELTRLVRLNQKIETDKTIPLDSSLVQRVARALKDQFDPDYGGFGYSSVQPNRPKFPEPSNLVFLIDRMNRKSVDQGERDAAKSMLLKTLDGMISGAMIDHLGGGFHRYSVDRRWQIPHFEKMLYDNGQLVSVFARAYQETKRDEYRAVAKDACDFVLAELMSPEGGFFSALDADSEGEEGKFYRWTKEEIQQLRKQRDDFELADNVYGFTQEPNFEGEYYAPDPRGTLTTIAKHQKLSFAQLRTRLAPIRAAMVKIREQRKRPLTDTKILTAWNGLMIAGLADAGHILDQDSYIQAAEKAANFVLEKLRTKNGKLLRTYAAGEAKLNAYVDDYAFLTSGMIALHRATGKPEWLEVAAELTDKQIELLWDNAEGGFFFTTSDHDALIVRSKDPADGALPSGISISAENLAYLSKHSDGPEYGNRLVETLQSMAVVMKRSPAGAPRIAAVLAEYLDQKP